MFVSIIIPIYNEEALIEKTLTFLSDASTKSQVEIIVVDGGSEDSSVKRARVYADKVLTGLGKGRAIQMHEGALAAKGDILLFLHVDTLLPDNWLNLLLNIWQNHQLRPNATAFDLKFDKKGWSYKLICWAARKRYLLTKVPHGDQAIAIDRETYFEYDGFPDVPIMEEYGFFNRLNGSGRISIIPEKVVTSARRYRKNLPLITALRNTFLVVLYYAGVSPGYLANFYR
ncbi:MAG: TIGR04283 family arsenosugar biosynthesis glycosyltransferase [Candidatus Anammoxibacter sp.]